MEKQRMRFALIFFIMVVNPLTLVMSQNFNSFADKKNYYSPDPHAHSPPGHSHKKPACPTPSHGGTGGTPSHGGGGYYNTPPTATTPSPVHGGGGYYNTPPIATTPSPSHGGGGFYNPPPTAPPTTPSPLVPLVPPSPTIPSPSVPLFPPSPSTPIFTPPSSPLIPDPNNPPFSPGTCNYWYTHPVAIYVLFGYWGTVGQNFGTPAILPFGRNLSLLEALGNTRGDGFGALFREGTASLLNSMANRRFVFTTQQVKDSFNAAVRSEKTAAIQAKIFQKANEGHLKH